MSVIAKFKVDSISRNNKFMKQNPETGAYEPSEVRTVELTPVYSSEPGSENKAFWDATPNGTILLGCANLPAAAFFDLGDEVYVIFTKEKPETALELGAAVRASGLQGS